MVSPGLRTVPETTTWAGGKIVGREAELDSLRRFLRREAGPRALVLAGAPGLGKTKLWEAGVAAARDQGLRVLSVRASDAEAQLSFAALIDLFDGVGSEELAALPAPQLEALEVALLRAAPTGPPPEAQAIAVGFLGALRALAARGAAARCDRRPPVARPAVGRRALLRCATARRERRRRSARQARWDVVCRSSRRSRQAGSKPSTSAR